jgi:dTDP-4-amino-4,6-dideoxygalactose transaminase
MFGFPMRLEKLFEVCKNDICVIEDACQAPGAKIDGKLVGSFAHCAIFSLCKGKNISTFSGGFAVFNDSKLAQIVRTERDKLAGQSSSLKLLALLIAYALAMRPGVYGFLYPLIKRFKSEELHRDFSALKYTSMQSVVGEILLEKLEMVNAQRRVHGLYMYEGLKDCSHLMLPAILPGTEAVFNHLPVVFLNENDRNRTQKLLWDKGIDTARMYMKPNHHIYDLGYPHSAFPDATLVAEGLVTLPTHPFMHQRDLETMVEVARKS